MNKKDFYIRQLDSKHSKGELITQCLERWEVQPTAYVSKLCTAFCGSSVESDRALKCLK